MTLVYLTLLVTGCLPLVMAWRRSRGASIEHAVCWLGAAWAAWGLGLVLGDAEAVGPEPARLVALALTAAVAVAVLGARRPYVLAWNFVVLGLVGVLLLPLVEMVLLGSQTLDALRLFFLAATLAIGIINYLPTRFGVAAVVAGLALAFELWALAVPESFPGSLPLQAVHVALLTVPWVALLPALAKRGPSSDLDHLWLRFRDAYGLVWGQRVREQFNNAAGHANWSGTLRWGGWRGASATQEMVATLRATLQRFL